MTCTEDCGSPRGERCDDCPFRVRKKKKIKTK